MVERAALVLLSGGQDSTTCLFWAKKHFKKVNAIGFDYGQRHKVELEAAAKIAALAGVPFEVKTIPQGIFADSALVEHSTKISEKGSKVDPKLPNTFVPGRNILFLTIAAIEAVKIGATELVTGVCQADYSGYPDCRHDTIRALQETLQLGISMTLDILTPLMFLTKSETVQLARILPGCMEALAHSVTCYEGKIPGCFECPSCRLRSKGFADAGILDPACVDWAMDGAK